jgi:hypothetical protein
MRAALIQVRRIVARAVFSELAFGVLGRVLGPRASGRLCARFIDRDGATPATSACLCINRDVFMKDISQLRARTERPWPVVNQHLIFLFEQAWVPRWYFKQTEFQAALQRLSPRAIDRAECFATSFLRSARARCGVAAVITGNVDYAPDEFLRRAAKLEGLPFLVLLKEHAITDYGYREFAKSLAGFRYEGDGVAVFGDRTADMLVEETICPPERIAVTGPPRLDEWIDIEPAPELDLAVLFSFSRLYQEGAETFPEVLEAFAVAAHQAQGSAGRFVVKCRDPYEETVVREMASAYGQVLEITSDALVPDLLRRATVTVGYSSLAMLEALLSWGTVVSPRFGACTN